MLKIDQLETPALLLDVEVMERNVTRMRSRLSELGVPLRPHVKTSKSVEVVRRALQAQPGGVTVSTLKEAEYCLTAGISDIVYAVGIARGKFAHAIDLIRRGANLTLVLDSTGSVEAFASAASAARLVVPVLIEIDVDGKRAGVQFHSPSLMDLGRAIHASAPLELRGVMAHAGASYDCRTAEALQAMAEDERSKSVRAAQRLRRAGLPCPVVSVGSTPTALFAQSLDGVTEVRAGVYMFQDLVMAGIGVCQIEDLAASVLVSVIGHQRDRGWIVTDGGWMALSRDRGTANQAVDQGYGLVRTAAGLAPDDDLIVISTSQEHGVVAQRSRSIVDVSRYPIGTLLRVLPNHACATTAQHQRYHLVSGSSPAVIGVWPRINGWH